MQAPDIDERSYDDLVAQTEYLARELSGWQPSADGRPDAGQALIRIFASFAELVVERLNRAPDKHFLAFLNVIGASPVPPRPARVPLTFSLAAESPVDALVAAGTLAGAPAQGGDQDEIVYETERSLVVTRAQLHAVYVNDPVADTFSDRSAQATGAASGPFPVFTGDQPSPHQLYLACDPLLTQPGAKDVTLTLASTDTWQWQNWPVIWGFWDGAAWQTARSTGGADAGSWRVALPSLPTLTPHAVNGVEAGWLRAQLALPLPHDSRGQPPDLIAIGARSPQEPAFPLTPFPADAAAQYFYLSADYVFATRGARAAIRVTLLRPGVGPDVQLDWQYHVADGKWERLGQSSASAERVGASGFDFRDGSLALTRDGEVSFQVPMDWPTTRFQNHVGRWLRVGVSAGRYTTSPEISVLTVGYDWVLPRLGSVVVGCSPVPPGEPLPPPAAFCDAIPVDLSKDFYPLGEQPVFNDTFYVACPDTLAWPGADVTLSVTLTNPAGSDPSPGAPPAVNPDNDPDIAWEVSDGGRWHAVTADYPLTENGQVAVTLPAPLARTAVNGDERYWLRARLVGGSYGDPVSYKEDEHGGFVVVPATLAPPVIKSLWFKPAPSDDLEAPVTACLSYNNFAYTDETAAATAPGAPPFTPFVPAQDAEPALYLGFDRAPGERPVTLFLAVEPPLPEQVAAERLAGGSPADPPRLTWDYAGPGGWEPLNAADETLALSRPGPVTFIGPRDLAERSHFEEDLAWLRLRWQGGDFPLPPRLRRVLPGTTWAAQLTTIANEILGSGNGDPGQAFWTAQTPVQPGHQVVVGETQLPPPLAEQAVVVQEDAGAVSVTAGPESQPEQTWVRWHAVPDFYESGPQDRHYTADALSGEIRFGDGAHGMIPPVGQNNIRITYRSGGGERGNRAAGTIVDLKSSVPYIDGVTNNEPAEGGAAAEPLDRLQDRGPHVLRHRGRAIAAQDLEDLAVAASADVARAAAIVPIFDPFSLWLEPDDPVPTPAHTAAHAGRMGVIIVQSGTGAARPAPSLGLLREVEAHLRARCPPTADLWVAGPEWIAVDVTAGVAVGSAQEADLVRDRVSAALARFLHPLTGGPRGEGWAFGRWPRASVLSALLDAVHGVDHVVRLAVSYRPDTADEERERELREILERPLTERPPPPELEPEVWHWLDRALVFSGRHDISVEIARADDQTVRTADADPAA
jgi:hypothetical protein